jgi:hypothetical protein
MCLVESWKCDSAVLYIGSSFTANYVQQMILEKPTVIQLIKKFSAFIKQSRYISRSQEPTTCL